MDLIQHLCHACQTADVDVSVLDTAEPLLLNQVSRAGIPVYERRHGEFTEFRLRSFKRYCDTRKLRELEAAYLDRFLQRGPGRSEEGME